MVFKTILVLVFVQWLVFVSWWTLGHAAPLAQSSIPRVRVKRFDTSLLTAHCGGLRHRCRHIPPETCVRACVHGEIKTVCRLTPAHANDRRCLVV